MSVIGNVTVQTLYTIAGLENPLIVEPALKAQVEHRSGELSRRGFLGLVGAATAGMVFDPVSKLWTPAKEATVVLAEQAVVSMDSVMLFLARQYAELVEERIEKRNRRRLAYDRSYPERIRNVQGYIEARPEDLSSLAAIWLTDHGTDYDAPRLFNEHRPLPVLPYERDPAVRVGDVMSPSGYMCRAYAYEQHNGIRTVPMIEFELMGRYVPHVKRERRKS